MAKKRKRGGTRDNLGGAKRQRSHRRRYLIISLITALSMLGFLGAALLTGVAGH